jgi:hypothetical protein
MTSDFEVTRGGADVLDVCEYMARRASAFNSGQRGMGGGEGWSEPLRFGPSTESAPRAWKRRDQKVLRDLRAREVERKVRLVLARPTPQVRQYTYADMVLGPSGRDEMGQGMCG